MVLHLIRKGIIEHGQKSGQKTERKNQKSVDKRKIQFYNPKQFNTSNR